jgi:hypothetical protein
MTHKMTRRALAALVPLSFGALICPARADVEPSMSGAQRLAIGGYDTVAYHTQGKAVPGRLEFQTIWHDARWQFSSKENLDLFTKDPEKYAAQYDGHCAMGLADADGHKDTVDPEAFTIINGKLYINHTKYWTTVWRKDAAANIDRGNKNWQRVKDTPEPVK